MTIKELQAKLEEKKAALVLLKDGIESEDVEAVKEATDLTAEIEGIQAELAAAQESLANAQAAIAAIGTPDTDTTQEETEMEDAKNRFKSMDLEGLKKERGSRSIMLKGADDPAPVAAPTISETSTKVLDAQPKLGVRDLFSSETISGNSLTYFVMGATKGAPDTTEQGATKPQIEPTYTPVTAALVKKAAHLHETDELLSDAPYLESVIRGRGAYEVRKSIEAYLVSALLGTSGIQVDGSGLDIDAILAAKMDILNDTGYEADAVIINPVDLQTILQSKDENGQYLFGGPAYAPYGNGAFNSYPTIWGLNIVPSSQIAQGTAIVGAFKTAGSVVTKNGEGFRVEVSNSNQDDFEKNMITVRIEERILEVIRVPAAFTKIYTSTSV